MVIRRQIAFIIYAFFKINDVQGRGTSMNCMLKIDLANDILKQFDQAWEEALVALDHEPESNRFGRSFSVDNWRIRLSF